MLLLLLLFTVSFSQSYCGSFVQFSGTDVTLGNDLFNITFRENATAKSVYKNGVNIIQTISNNMQSWYLDWNGEKAYFSPGEVRVVSNSSEKAHISFIQKGITGVLDIEFHLVVLEDVSGLYQYVKASNNNNETVSLAEFRTVYRFDETLMPKMSNMVLTGSPPNVSGRPTIQDTTWQLSDGTYWSKYDFCGYLRDTPWLGVFGGGFGGWLISASREYHSGGPLKQELMVHQISLMLNYFHSGHFGTAGLHPAPEWSKFYGPYLIYINTGSDEELLKDVARQTLVEQSLWPYSWVDDPDYPLSRGTVSGKITGQTKAMVVVYDDKEHEFDVQSLGYLYHIESEADGSFSIKNIRPGDYQLVAYPLAGQGSENLVRMNISVNADEILDVGSLELPEPTNIIWSIGETNRKSDSYRYSRERRDFYWHLLPPANLTFTINMSKIDVDWYYAQTRSPGIWKIAYNDKPDSNGRLLRVAFAAASQSASINILINNKLVGHHAYANDMTIYRDALQSGNFHAEQIQIPMEYVVDGENIISFSLLRGMVMYDAISLAVDVGNEAIVTMVE
ncbi:rhamnogalacturonate lyase-like [Anthonomus grandis grandis]|uniref:rhamnogalacturonate lyase-like n=1 Tax=Anthonomus grandis grandis TaxID=2921223 RepID=UPI002165DA76|nr:rhamnogalacturonate lyase-like [Anthonomus grandis grandis]